MTIRFITENTSNGATTSTVEPFQFPGGEWHLRASGEGETPAFARVTGCDVNNLVALGLWADWMHSNGHRAVAHMPYLPAARADRGVPFGAKVYAQMINALGLDEVVVFDPHSPVAPSLINNVRVVQSTELIADRVIPAGDYAAILAPDQGAVERARLVAERAGLPLYTATKSRNFDTGKLTGFQAPSNLPENGRVLIVDDICDGGGTFMGLAEVTGIPRNRLDLWVSHGIFSGQAPNLHEHFSIIWTTDSHTGAHNPDVNARVLEIENYLK